MLKTILNLNGVELLSKNQQKRVVGKLGAVQECAVYAPADGTRAEYPYFPCAEVIGTPNPRLCVEPGRGGEVYFC